MSQHGQEQPQGAQQMSLGSCTGTNVGGEARTPGKRKIIWQGFLEIQLRPKDPKIKKRNIPISCQVSTSVVNGEVQVKADDWPDKIPMQFVPKYAYTSFGAHLRNARYVMFHLQECTVVENMTKVMSTEYNCCVYFPRMEPQPDIRMIILMYIPDKRTYIGVIPNDQYGFMKETYPVLKEIDEKLRREQQEQQLGSVAMATHVGAPQGVGSAQPEEDSSVKLMNELSMAVDRLGLAHQFQE